MIQDAVKSKELQAIKDDIDSLRSDLRSLMKTAKGEGRGRLEDIRDLLMEASRDLEARAEEQLRQAMGVARERGEEAVERSREEISKRPLTMVLSSMAIGLVLGALLRRS